jgi:hypothetical protein
MGHMPTPKEAMMDKLYYLKNITIMAIAWPGIFTRLKEGQDMTPMLP